MSMIFNTLNIMESGSLAVSETVDALLREGLMMLTVPCNTVVRFNIHRTRICKIV